MVLQSSGPISISDIAVEFCPPPAATFNFAAAVDSISIPGSSLSGIHTASPPTPNLGVWLSPLPILSLGASTGTTSAPQLFPDGFDYGCGMLQHVVSGSFISLSLSLSRWNGLSFDLANGGWTPFSNMIVNGPNWPNTSLLLSLAGTSSAFSKELFVSWVGAVPMTPFTNNGIYTITFN